MSSGNLFLMYHELELPKRPLCQAEPGYVRYIVPEADFRSQIRFLRDSGLPVMNVTQSFAATVDGIVLTFDDGCETDLLTAAPILKEAGFNATFYITTGFLGTRGYLLPGQLRDLSDRGFEIGCHSMTHPYLDELDSKNLKRELGEAKSQLEDIIGRGIDHFSCPGGRWSPRVVEAAKQYGYTSVATSRVGRNLPAADRFALARVAVMRGLRLPDFRNLCQGQGLRQMQLREQARGIAKRLLGNSAYDKLRALALSEGPNSPRKN
jgi:peptidoglycan/xylan/chitin deacetylase (PgdA/CDA1 family)